MLSTEWFHEGGVQEHEPRAHSTESGINMSDGTSTTAGATSAGMSPLRLRLGCFFILLWLLPFWALAPYVAHALSGLSNAPSVAAVTTSIVVVQTIIGLLGLWVAGTEVKSIVKGSTMRHAVATIWSILLHGSIRDQGADPSRVQQHHGDEGGERHEGDHEE
jgi:hypothetical protein